MHEGQEGIADLEEAGEHLLGEGAAGSGDLDDEQEDADRLADVAERDRERIGYVHEHD